MELHFRGPHSNDSISWGLMHIAVTTSFFFFFFLTMLESVPSELRAPWYQLLNLHRTQTVTTLHKFQDDFKEKVYINLSFLRKDFVSRFCLFVFVVFIFAFSVAEIVRLHQP